MNKVIMYFLSKLTIYLVVKTLDLTFDLLKIWSRRLKKVFRKKRRELKSDFEKKNDATSSEGEPEAFDGTCHGDHCGVSTDFQK